MDRLPPDLLAAPVEGLHLDGGTLSAQLDPARPTLLVFLRHFGCIFCREMVADVRRAKAADASYPPVLFFYQGTVEQGRAFFDGLWPEARAVADPDKRFYDGVELERGSVGQMFGGQVWACGVRAAAKGHFVGAPVGDPWTMPGVFLVEADGRVLWQHDFAHAGDHPDFARLAEYARPAA
jgi:hypothetical protein